MTLHTRRPAAALLALTLLLALAGGRVAAQEAGEAEETLRLRVIARQAENGVEFGLRLSEGDLAPLARFPEGVEHTRWLRSRAITVAEGVAVRIIARRGGDGRLEFGLRLEGAAEPLLPHARFFPLDVGHGRWLQSSPLSLPVPAASVEAEPESSEPEPEPTPEPAPEPTPEPEPEPPTAEEIIAAAASSVVRVVADERVGSGVIVSADGLVLTAQSVVAGAERIRVELAGGRGAEGELLGRDLGRGLALLRIERDGLAAAAFAERETVAALAAGDELAALGCGACDEATAAVRRGAVTAVSAATLREPARVRLDSALARGDAGAPLITPDGRIAAIITSESGNAEAATIVGSLIEDGGGLLERLAAGELVCDASAAFQRATQAEAPEAEPNPVYRHERDGWSVRLPGGYEPFQAAEGGPIVFYEAAEGAAGTLIGRPGPAEVWVDPRPKADAADAPELIGDWLDFWTAHGYEVERHGETREVCRGGALAWEQEFTLRNETVDYLARSRFMVVERESRWYLLRVAADPDLYEEYRAAADTILYSLRFDEPGAAP